MRMEVENLVTLSLKNAPFIPLVTQRYGKQWSAATEKSVEQYLRDCGVLHSQYTKDHIEKIDFQEPFFAVVNWSISEFYGASICIMHYFDQTAG